MSYQCIRTNPQNAHQPSGGDDSLAGSPRRECLFDRLPDELLVHILAAVGSEDVVMRVHAVCRRWRAACRNVPIFVENWGDVFADYCEKVHGECDMQSGTFGEVSGTIADLSKSFADRFRVEGLPSGWMSRSDLAWVAQFCPHLRTLCIFIKVESEWDLYPTATAIKDIAEACQQVKTVVVENEIDEDEADADDPYFAALRLTDDTLAILGRSFRHLNSLELKSRSDITDDGLVGLVQAAPTLRSLALRYCATDTDAGLKRIFDAAPLLISLNVHRCASVTPASVKLCGERLMLEC